MGAGSGAAGAVLMFNLWRFQSPGNAAPPPTPSGTGGEVSRRGEAGVQEPGRAWVTSLRPPLQAWVLSLVPGGQAPLPLVCSAHFCHILGRVSQPRVAPGGYQGARRRGGASGESWECPQAIMVFDPVRCGCPLAARSGLDVSVEEGEDQVEKMKRAAVPAPVPPPPARGPSKPGVSTPSLGAESQDCSLQGAPELAAKEKPLALRRPLPALAPHYPPTRRRLLRIPGEFRACFPAVTREPGLSLPKCQNSAGRGPGPRSQCAKPRRQWQQWPSASRVHGACWRGRSRLRLGAQRPRAAASTCEVSLF